MAKITEIKLNLNLTTLLLIATIVLLVFGGGWKLYQNKVDKLQDKLEAEEKLKDALLDKITFYKNKEKEWVAEKLTIQTSIKNLEKINGDLTSSQLELLLRVKQIQKDNSIITAALINTQISLDSLIHKGNTEVDISKKNIIFTDTTSKDLKYIFTIGKALPAYKDTLPTLTFNMFQMPNKQFIEFHWKNDKKKGYPIAFSVSNSNKYFKVVNIDSYAIPNLKKSDLDPNFWQKIGNWADKNKNAVISIGVAGIVGAGIGIYLIK